MSKVGKATEQRRGRKVRTRRRGWFCCLRNPLTVRFLISIGQLIVELVRMFES